jgi:hypothetical protein
MACSKFHVTVNYAPNHSVRYNKRNNDGNETYRDTGSRTTQVTPSLMGSAQKVTDRNKKT